MDINEEDAPALVDVNEVKKIVENKQASSIASQLRELSLAKVPLTIVTGELNKPSRKLHSDLSLISNMQATLAQGRLHWSTTSLKSNMARKLQSY